MYGESPSCLLVVFSNPRSGDGEELGQWYREVHAVDAMRDGPFVALRRYEAVGKYAARFLALWEGSFASAEEARARLTPKAGGLRDQGRITNELVVVWSSLEFLTKSSPASATVATLTLAEGRDPDLFGEASYRYGNVAFYESPDSPDEVVRQWSGRGEEGIAPHGPYRSIFDHPEAWPPPAALGDEVWISHWRPILSLRREDLELDAPR
jgi:hypothetical protein